MKFQATLCTALFAAYSHAAEAEADSQASFSGSASAGILGKIFDGLAEREYEYSTYSDYDDYGRLVSDDYGVIESCDIHGDDHYDDYDHGYYHDEPILNRTPVKSHSFHDYDEPIIEKCDIDEHDHGHGHGGKSSGYSHAPKIDVDHFKGIHKCPITGKYSENPYDAVHAKHERGPIKQARRRPKPPSAETQPEIQINRIDGKFHDWRDYEPNMYKTDPYYHCVWPKDRKNLDTKEYQNLSAVCKQEFIWQLSLQDTRRERFYKGKEFQSLFDQDMNLTYDVITDTMPEGRLKKTHPVGLVAKVEFIPHPDQPYTGMFKGAKNGIMRISDTTATTPEINKTTPGFGLKFLRDGMSSANILAMFSFDGQTSFNFFKNRWVTILREMNNVCAKNTIGKHLATVTDHIGGTSVMEVAQFDEYGHEEEYPHWPFQLEFEPYDVFGWTDEYQNDFQDQIETIPWNTVMFKVFAFDTPPEEYGEDHLIGWIVSRSDNISSFWADTQLFFQHRRMDDDIKFRPHYFDWLQFWDNGKFTETPLINPAPQQRCPFFFLFSGIGLV